MNARMTVKSYLQWLLICGAVSDIILVGVRSANREMEIGGLVVNVIYLLLAAGMLRVAQWMGEE